MGVPTITLAGSHYVSRMSTAVLKGVGMSDWIAQDEQDYVRLASEHASRISQLRNDRERWRYQLQKSPLGDPSDLMRHLESSSLKCIIIHLQSLSILTDFKVILF